MAVEKIPLTLEDGVHIPGFEDRGPVQGEFTMYLGFAGSWDQPPEDPHVEDVQVRTAAGVQIDLEGLTEDEWGRLDAALWVVAEAWWAATAAARAQDEEAYAAEWAEMPF